MEVFEKKGFGALAALTAGALVSACAANSAMQGTPTAANGAATGAMASRVFGNTSRCPQSVAYVVSSQTQTVKAYDRTNLKAGPCGTIDGFSSPQGLFVDAKGGLWVADAAMRTVFQFAPGKKAPTRELSDPSGVPIGIAVDDNRGTVYVTEYKNDLYPGTLVEVYAPGSDVPTASLSAPNAMHGGYPALDDRGNLYVTFMTNDDKAHVDRWKHGAGSPEDLGLKLVSAGGIATTGSGALAICDPYAFRCGVFAQGSNTMSHVFGHMGRLRGGIIPDKPPIIMPRALALNRGERHAYVISESLSSWNFPGPAHRPNHLPVEQVKIPGLGGEGIAVTPAARPGAPY